MLKKLKRELFLWWMLIFVPISIYFGVFTNNLVLTFITAIIAIVPLAQIMGFATHEIAMQTNASISGLVSATFGNLIELIIAINAIRAGLVRVVQASIVGSIIGNVLLLIGLSVLFGGLKHRYQEFNKRAIGVSSTMLIIVVVGLAIPSVYGFLTPGGAHVQLLSDLVAIIMAIMYLAGLVFALKTHRDMFDATDEIKEFDKRTTLSIKASAIILFFSIIVVAVLSEFLVKGIEASAKSIGITETFIGVVIIAIITNIAEKSAAINFALKNKLDVSIEIGLSSAIQIALFVVPLLVIISEIFNYNFTLSFSMFEVAALLFSVMIINDLAADGRSNWIEGAQLLAVYLILATAFFFI